jgi:DNA repair exonuclease SbcCD ATPase subunit
MNKEQLLAAGFSEAQAATILDIYKKALDGQYVPKHRFDEVNTELKTVKEQLTERDTQITSLKKFEGDSKALSDKIKELEEANKQKDTEYKNNLALERKKNAVRLALLEDANGKPHDADMVMGLFDLDKIVMDETTGKIKDGFKDQNDSIRKEKAFLFEVKADPNKSNGWKPKGTEPKDGDDSKGPDTSEAYGKSLAAIKLGMMGINPGNGAE